MYERNIEDLYDYIGNDEILEIDKNLSIKEKLTIIITTSPIPSHPSTELLDIVFSSFRLVDGLYECRKIIIADGTIDVEERLNVFSKKKPEQIKSGIVSLDLRNRYHKYLLRVQEKCNSSQYLETELIVQPQRNGYAKNLEIALNLVTTPLVMVVQHDQIFQRNIPLLETVEGMLNFPNDIKYVGLMSTSDQNYVQKELSHSMYRNFYQDLETEINVYIKRNRAAAEEILFNFPSKSKKIKFEDDKTSNKSFVTDVILRYTMFRYGVPLMPLMFFYDKIHICNTDYYLNYVFNNYHIDYTKGDSFAVKNFVEDTLGQIEKSNIKRQGIAAFHNYQTYILYDDPENSAIYHGDGRAFRSSYN